MYSYRYQGSHIIYSRNLKGKMVNQTILRLRDCPVCGEHQPLNDHRHPSMALCRNCYVAKYGQEQPR